ncbi:MAG: hypothetical protein IPJ07_10775 [Acidobacteria bacterium]|nr:hypothetical protein [Acidobacteriota bacterium]
MTVNGERHNVFNEGEWNDYIEGQADEALRPDRSPSDRMSGDAGEINEQLARANESLASAGESLRGSFNMSDRALYSGLQRVFEKLRAADFGTYQLSIQQKLGALTDVMAPMCGSQTAIKALRAAALESPALTRSPQRR